MAISASREFGHDTCRMLLSVAILAFRDHFVLFLMTIGARQGRMLCLGRFEEVVWIAVACGAIYGTCIRSVGHDLRHMRLMALLAVSRHHIGGMGLVALRAGRRLTVDAVARGAIESRMFALIFTQLLDLSRMAG